MRYHFFSVRAIDPEPDRQGLNTFLAAHPVLSVEREFVADGGNSYWAFCISLAEPGDQATPGDKVRKRGSIDYREVLPAEVFTVYAKLRALRNGLAEEQDTPRYAIFTNDQLATMAQLRQPSKAAIAAIEGIGEKRLALYADAFLAVLLETASG